MKRARSIALSIKVTTSLLFLSSIAMATDSNDTKTLRTEGNAPETEESKKISRFSRFRSKAGQAISDAADKSKVIQTGKNFARKTGEVAKAQSPKEAVKTAGEAGLAGGKFAVKAATAPVRAEIRAAKSAVKGVAKAVSGKGKEQTPELKKEEENRVIP